MADFETEMNKVVLDFVERVAALAHRAAVETIEFALSAPKTKRHTVKRRSDQIASLSGTVVSFVARHPGLRIEQINRELKTTTKELAGPIRKLIASGSIKTKGARRGRVYFAAQGE